MVRFSLVPHDVRFFNYFEEAGQNLVEMSRALHDLLTDYRDLDNSLQRLRDFEHTGDTITQQVMRALNKTFITPLDREDITALVRSLDDVADKAWAAATRLHIYRIPEPTEASRGLARALVQMTEQIAEALPHLRRRGQMQRIMPIAEQIGRLETEADDCLRDGLRGLYANPDDPRDIVLSVKWREIYDFLEGATDSADDVANVLEGIVLKHG